MALLFSVLTGILFGLQSILVKFALLKQSQVQVLKYLFSIAGIVLLPLALIEVPTVHLVSFSTAFSISLFINIAAYLLLFTAIKISPISIVMPYIGFTPLFLTLSGYLILDEQTGILSFWGILLILVGGFILQLPVRLVKEKKFTVLRFFNREEKGIYFALAAAFLWSISASVEKIAVFSSSPEFYGAAIHLALGLVFLLFAQRNTEKAETNKTNSGKNIALLLVIGIVSAILALTQLTAIQLTQVSTVIAFKRTGVLISGLAGLFYFKEGHYLKTITGTIVLVCGAVLVSAY